MEKQICTCSRLYRFESSHREWLGEKGRSFEVFEHATFSHGHNYELNINVTGRVDPKTGMVLELGSLDYILDEYLKSIDHQNFSDKWGEEKPLTHEYITLMIYEGLKKRLGTKLNSISLSTNEGEASNFIHKVDTMIYQTRTFRFNAQHQLSNPELSDEENRLIFGKCINPHGHDYVLQVTIKGWLNKTSNKLLIERAFHNRVQNIVEKFDYYTINELDEFKGKVATTEEIIKVIFDKIDPVIEKLGKNEYAGDDVCLVSLELQETNRNKFLYFGDKPASIVNHMASIL